MKRLLSLFVAALLFAGSALAQAPAPIAPPSTSGTTVNVPASVCTWNGTTGVDATATIQAAIATASAANGEVDLPATPCMISAALTIPANVTVRGQGCFENWGTAGTAAPKGSYVYPVGGLSGGGLVQTKAATDIIDITGTGITVNLYNFCAQFAKPYINTGDGIAVIPPALSGYLDHGLIGGIIQGVKVFGNDGNHWGFNLQNTLLTSLIGDRSYGGAGLRMYNNSANYEYGNLNVQDFYVGDYIGGSADAVVCDGNGVAGVNQVYSVFTRLQVWLWNAAGSGFTQPPGTTAPTNAQHLFSTGANGLCAQMTEVMPDFETNVTGGTAILPTIRNQILNGSIVEADTIQGGFIGNAALTLTPSNNTAYQNLTGTSVQYNLTMQLTTGGPSAVSVYVGPQAADIGNVSWLQSYIGSVTTLSQSQYQTMTFVIPSGFYFGVAFSGNPGAGANASVVAASYVRVPGF